MKALKKAMLFCSIILIGALSQSTVMDEFTLTELVEKSSNIIEGKVTNVVSYTQNDGKHIYTDVTLKIRKSIKGELFSGGKVKITQFGGTGTCPLKLYHPGMWFV